MLTHVLNKDYKLFVNFFLDKNEVPRPLQVSGVFNSFLKKFYILITENIKQKYLNGFNVKTVPPETLQVSGSFQNFPFHIPHSYHIFLNKTPI